MKTPLVAFIHFHYQTTSPFRPNQSLFNLTSLNVDVGGKMKMLIIFALSACFYSLTITASKADETSHSESGSDVQQQQHYVDHVREQRQVQGPGRLQRPKGTPPTPPPKPTRPKPPPKPTRPTPKPRTKLCKPKGQLHEYSLRKAKCVCLNGVVVKCKNCAKCK
jgi:hypothetical protein